MILTSALVLIYLIVLFFKPRLWLVILPALIPVLDFTPWIGLELFNNFDVLVLATFLFALVRGRVSFAFFRHFGEIKILLIFLSMSYVISGILGYLNNSEYGLASYYLFTTELNSIRMIKGFFEAMLLLPLLHYEKRQNYPITKQFAFGLFLGMFLALIVVVWERFIFTGLFDFTTPFSMTGLFSSSLIAGTALDTFLVIGFPFILLSFYITKSKFIKLIAAMMIIGSVYAVLVTFSRVNVIAVLIMIIVYGFGHYRYIYQSDSFFSRLSPLFLIIVLVSSSVFILNGSFIKERSNHWSNTLDLIDNEQFSYVFGMGKGTYPNTYLSQDFKGIGMARFWHKDKNLSEEPRGYLRFGPSDKQGDLRVLQRAAINDPDKHEVIITLRNSSDKKQRLLVEFCAKNYLTFSKRCQWRSFEVPANQMDWLEEKQSIKGEFFTDKRLSSITPVTVDLLNRGLAFGLDIRSVRVLDKQKNSVLENTGFDNFEHWMFSSFQPKAWTVNSLYLDAFFEGGGIELLLMILLSIAVLIKAYVETQKGSILGLVFLTSFSGLIYIGLFSSVLNDPKISFIVFALFILLSLKPEKLKLTEKNRFNLLPYLLAPLIVFLMAITANVAFWMNEKSMGLEDVWTLIEETGSSKLNVKKKLYSVVLSDKKIEHLLGQGANRAYSPLKTAYDNQGKPFTLNENAISPLAINVVKVSNVAQLKKAVSTIQPGYLIELLPGEYKFKGVKITKHGTKEQPIILFAQNLGDVQIKFTSVVGFNVQASHWTFQNLDIVGVCQTQAKCQHAFHLVGNADGTIIRNNIMTDFNAAIKSNGDGKGDYPDNVLIEKNTISNNEPRNTKSPVTPIDVVGGNDWRIKANHISDFIKLRGNKVAMGAFLKGYSKRGIFEENLVQCNRQLYRAGHPQVGLSFGGGGTGKRYCFDGKCEYEHDGGILRNNIIQNCNDVGIYLNKAKNTSITNNTLINTNGIDVRFKESNAVVSNNVLNNQIRNRNLATLEEYNNFIVNDLKLFNKWFADVEHSDFTWQTLKGIPKYPSDVETSFCGDKVVETRLVGAISQQLSAECQMILSNSLFIP